VVITHPNVQITVFKKEVLNLTGGMENDLRPSPLGILVYPGLQARLPIKGSEKIARENNIKLLN
jgi:hypothetical protein